MEDSKVPYTDCGNEAEGAPWNGTSHQRLHRFHNGRRARASGEGRIVRAWTYSNEVVRKAEAVRRGIGQRRKPATSIALSLARASARSAGRLQPRCRQLIRKCMDGPGSC